MLRNARGGGGVGVGGRGGGVGVCDPALRSVTWGWGYWY